MSRFYSRSRRAWTPRYWPNALLSAAVVFGVLTFAAMTPLEGVALGVGVGVGVGLGRWEIWKWMHPEITPDDYFAEMRRAAPWN
jgi:hypothetical protein